MINALILIIVGIIYKKILWYGVLFFALIDIFIFVRIYHKETEPLKKCVSLLVRPIDSILWPITVACFFDKHYFLSILSLLYGFYIGSCGADLTPSEKDELQSPFPPQTQENKNKYIIYLYNHFYRVSVWNFAISGAVYLIVMIYFISYSHLFTVSISILWIIFYMIFSRYILKINGTAHLGKDFM